MDSYPLLEEQVYPVASREFIAAHELRGPQCLGRVPLLQLENFTSPLMDWNTWLQTGVTPIIRRLTTYAMVLEAARFGHGVALGWHPYVRQAVEKGDLVRLPIEERTSTYREFLVVKSASRRRFSVEQTKDWIIELARASGQASL